MVPTESVSLQLPNGQWMQIHCVAPQAFRIRMNNIGHFSEAPLIRYGVIRLPHHIGSHSVQSSDNTIMLNAEKATLVIDANTGCFSLNNQAGRVCVSTPEAPSSRTDSGFDVQFALKWDERIYGLGDITPTHLQRNGSFTIMEINSTIDCNPIPYAISSQGWAILMNTTWRHTFDVGATTSNRLHIRGESGELDFFLFAGGSYNELLEIYTQIAGKPKLLPIWDYGLSFNHVSPITAKEVLNDALSFREAGIPCDVIGLRSWTQNPLNEGELEGASNNKQAIVSKAFINMLHRHGFKLNLWISTKDDLTKFEEQQLGGYEHSLSNSYYEQIRELVEYGVSGFMLSSPYPREVHSNIEWSNGLQEGEMRNLYPLLLGKQLYNGFSEETGTRPLLKIGFGFTGIQQFAATPSGTYDSTGAVVAALLNLGFSGQMNVMSKSINVDSKEGIHFGFLQPCPQINNRTYFRHPSFLEVSLRQLFRSYAKLRYRLLPYLYSAAHTGVHTGMPIMRAMPLMFPNDQQCLELTHQYMLGDYLLVGAYTDRIYIPGGLWIDYWTKKRHYGPKTIGYEESVDAGGPLYVCGGAIIPMWPDMDYIGQAEIKQITLQIFPYGYSEFTLTEDDGISQQYLGGQVATTKIRCEADKDQTVIHIDPRIGTYTGMPAKRSYELVIYPSGKPSSVSVNHMILPEHTRRIKLDMHNGWRYDRLEGTVRLTIIESEQRDEDIQILLDHSSFNTKSNARSDHPNARKSTGKKDLESVLDAALGTSDLIVAKNELSLWWYSGFDAVHGMTLNDAGRLRLMNVCLSIVGRAEKIGINANEIFGDHLKQIFDMRHLETLDEGFQLLLRLVEQLIKFGARIKTSSSHPVILDLIEIINRDLDQDLSLRDFAERASLHPVHLSRLFKKERGETFSDYVLKQRMSRAKQLLESGLKVYETAAMCGFKDAGNFSRAFHKYWGVSPVIIKNQ